MQVLQLADQGSVARDPPEVHPPNPFVKCVAPTACALLLAELVAVVSVEGCHENQKMRTKVAVAQIYMGTGCSREDK